MITQASRIIERLAILMQPSIDPIPEIKSNVHLKSVMFPCELKK